MTARRVLPPWSVEEQPLAEVTLQNKSSVPKVTALFPIPR
jgi:hypothetical protein